MERHVEMYRRLLQSIELYSGNILDRLNGSGDLPQWANDLISESRTHLSDVAHFLRGQDVRGIRYGHVDHGRAYMAVANVRQINEYARECLSLMQKNSGNFPAWAENKISVVARYMDLIGHWLKNENTEGRNYGSQKHPLGKNADVDAVYRGRADGISHRHRNPFSPNDFRRKLYAKGFEEGRSYSAGPMEFIIPQNRMLESHRQGLQHRQLWQQTGRRFGVPGFVPGQPGWAGQAGVAQIPRPSRGVRRAFQPVETYGSLGYASMGDGSMDAAVRGSRVFAGRKSKKKYRKKKRKR